MKRAFLLSTGIILFLNLSLFRVAASGTTYASVSGFGINGLPCGGAAGINPASGICLIWGGSYGSSLAITVNGNEASFAFSFGGDDSFASVAQLIFTCTSSGLASISGSVVTLQGACTPNATQVLGSNVATLSAGDIPFSYTGNINPGQIDGTLTISYSNIIVNIHPSGYPYCMPFAPYPCVAPYPNGTESGNLSLLTTVPAIIDPVPDLLDRDPNSGGVYVTDSASELATGGTPVQGVAADDVTEVVLRIPAATKGGTFQLTILNDQNNQSNSMAEDGALANPGPSPNFQSTLQVSAQATDGTTGNPMAFAVYRAPSDFARLSGGAYKQGSCGSVINTDDQLACRSVSIHVQGPTGNPVSIPITIVRPPVVLIHGLWSNPKETWGAFAPLFSLDPQTLKVSSDSRFFVRAADYSYKVAIQSSTPPWSPPILSHARANALGFAFNAPSVLGQIKGYIQTFKQGGSGIPVAAVQADIVAHSMGGNIARTVPLVNTFFDDFTFGAGSIHKLITIDTPHLGSPLATNLLNDMQNSNFCVGDILALSGSIAFDSVIIDNQFHFGAAGDLEGDGFGGGLSPTLTALKHGVGTYTLPTALIAAEEDPSALAGLDNCTACAAAIAHKVCSTDPLTPYLTSQKWQSIYDVNLQHSPGDDAVVPFISQVNGLTNGPFTLYQNPGLIHSPGTRGIGFAGPSVLEVPSVANHVINLLNTPVTNSSIFTTLTP